MTPTPPPAEQNPLAPATLNTLLRSTLDALPHRPQASVEEIADRRHAAMQAIAALGPRDSVQTGIAGRTIAAHYAMMEAFRCAAQPDLPPALKLRFQGRAIGLARMMAVALREPAQRQDRPPLRVAQPPAVPQPRPQPAAAPRTAPAPLPAAETPPAQAGHPARAILPPPPSDGEQRPHTPDPVPPAPRSARCGRDRAGRAAAPRPPRTGAPRRKARYTVSRSPRAPTLGWWR